MRRKGDGIYPDTCVGVMKMGMTWHSWRVAAPFCPLQENFHDRLDWKSDSSVRRTPAWRAGVRRTLTRHPSFCHAGTPERNVFTLAE